MIFFKSTETLSLRHQDEEKIMELAIMTSLSPRANGTCDVTKRHSFCCAAAFQMFCGHEMVLESPFSLLSVIALFIYFLETNNQCLWLPLCALILRNDFQIFSQHLSLEGF